MSAKKDFEVDTSGVSDLLEGLSGRFGDDAPGNSDGKTARRHDGTLPQVAGSRSKYTVLLDLGDALAFDELAMVLRRRCGRRVDKAEIIRALITLAGEHPAVLEPLVKALCRRDSTA